MMETKNATIESTMLGTEDHGILTFYLSLDYGGSGQSAGGYGLDDYDKTLKRRKGTAYGLQLIQAVMETVGVTKWEDLKGKHIRVQAEHTSIKSIGHFLENKWLNFADFKEV